METLSCAAAVVMAAAVVAGAGAARARAASLCLGGQPGCYTTIQAALDAARAAGCIV